MEKVLRAVERLADEVDDSSMKMIIPLARSPHLPLTKAALDVIAKFGNSKRGRIFSQLFTDCPNIRAELTNRLPLLSSENFARFMSEIPGEFHSPVIFAMFSTLAEEDPRCFGMTLSSVLRNSRSSRKKRSS